MTPNNSESRAGRMVGNILKASEEIFHALRISIPPEWLKSDMTVAQLRVLLLLHSEGPGKMSDIAASLGTAVSTATGIIDNLVKKGLVMRRSDIGDRRLVICSLSTQGQAVIDRIWVLGQSQMKRLLNGLSLEELEKADEVAAILLRNVALKTKPAQVKNDYGKGID